MFIRVDDYPSGSELCCVENGYRESLARLMDALGHPFCLGVVFGFLPPDEVAYLRTLPGVHVAAHGWSHNIHDCGRADVVKAMRARVKGVAPTIVIPPKNVVGSRYALLHANFDLILTGNPEKPRTLPGLLYPAASGVATDLLKKELAFGANDILCLHLGWEVRDNFAALKELGKRLTAVQDWTYATRLC